MTWKVWMALAMMLIADVIALWATSTKNPNWRRR